MQNFLQIFPWIWYNIENFTESAILILIIIYRDLKGIREYRYDSIR